MITSRVLLLGFATAILIGPAPASEHVRGDRTRSVIANDVLSRVGDDGTVVLCQFEVIGGEANYRVIEHWTQRRPAYP